MFGDIGMCSIQEKKPSPKVGSCPREACNGVGITQNTKGNYSSYPGHRPYGPDVLCAKIKKSCKCRNPRAEGTSIAMFLSHCLVMMTSSPNQAKCDMVSCLLVFVHTAPSAQNILFYPTLTTQYPAFPPPHHLFLWLTPTASSLGVITLEKLS